jgi:stress response protein YsnF
VVDKKVVAKEKVSLEKDVDVDHAHINETVRKERVEVDGDVETDN